MINNFKPICRRPAWMGKLAMTALLSMSAMTMMPAAAAVIDINAYVTGTPNNPGTATVARLTLTQNGANVDFTLANLVNNLASNLGDDAFISQLLLSFDGTPKITSASFTNFGGTQVFGTSAVSVGKNNNAGYGFSIGIDYPTSNKNKDDRFVHGETSSWTILGVTEADFLQLISRKDDKGPDALAMVHVQRVGAGTGGEGSLKYVGGTPTNEVPEPATLAMLGMGLLGLTGLRRRKPTA